MDNKKATLALGTKPVGQLLRQYALPAIVAMVASSLYNIIDRAFIGQVVGPMAISGLAITFPFMNLSGAFGAAVGVGASTAISVKLGQKDYQTAEQLLGNTVTLNLLIGFVFSVVCLVFLDPILYFFGASNETLPYARSFMQIILLGNMVTHMYFGMNAVLRAASKPRQAMNATIFTVLMNILLDSVFILWWGWGIRGAAVATVLSQSMALMYQLKLFMNKQQLLHFKRGIYRLRKDLVGNIISVGVSPFLMNLCACLIVIFMNNQLVRYGGDLSVGSYGIANAISTIFMMFVIGVNQGMQPIAGYNYGSQQLDRLIKVLQLAILSATIIMTTGWMIAMFLPYYCARLFTTDPTLIEISIKAIRIDMLFFPFVGSQMVITNFFQCIRKVKVSIFLSLSRQLLFLLPLLYILPQFFGLDGVWYALPASDITAAIVANIIMFKYMGRLKKQIKTINNE
ncbi:MAG: MATE family efflux transporter [Prevotella sp.]|mgnify:CR=1 FL=1|jgi:putative MATE family efflux protein|nr:MATE family efflux transporter [Prevotella sp.]